MCVCIQTGDGTIRWTHIGGMADTDFTCFIMSLRKVNKYNSALVIINVAVRSFKSSGGAHTVQKAKYIYKEAFGKVRHRTDNAARAIIILYITAMFVYANTHTYTEHSNFCCSIHIWHTNAPHTHVLYYKRKSFKCAVPHTHTSIYFAHAKLIIGAMRAPLLVSMETRALRFSLMDARSSSSI